MGKGRDRASPWSVYADRGIAHLNTTIAGVRHRPSLGIPYNPATASRRDVRAVEEAAAEAYAKLVAGRTLEQKPGSRVLTTLTLQELGGLWLLEAKKLWPKSFKTRVIQLRNVINWAEEAERFQKDSRTPLERLVDDAGPSQYAADRLQQVLRDTFNKEQSNLFAFLSWAKRERHIAAVPSRAELPRLASGVRSGTQREEPVDVTYGEAIAICNALPEYAVRGGRGIVPGRDLPPKAFVVRDRVRLAFEMALRPGDAGKLEVGRHWKPGQTYLTITPDIDKVGFSGRIALTKTAQAILERHAPESGLIFGRHDLRAMLKKAALQVLPEEKAKLFSAYDFRHGRAVDALATTNDLLGTSRLLRHTQLTTTNRYLRTREAHVESVVEKLDAVSVASAGTSERAHDDSLGTEENRGDVDGLVRRRGLEPLRCYPLAPQREETESYSADSGSGERQAATESASESSPEDPSSSASGQHLAMAQRKLAFERSLWDAFDRFALENGEDES